MSKFPCHKILRARATQEIQMGENRQWWLPTWHQLNKVSWSTGCRVRLIKNKSEFCKTRAITKYYIAIGSYTYYIAMMGPKLPITIFKPIKYVVVPNMVHFHFPLSSRTHQLQNWTSISHNMAFAWFFRALRFAWSLAHCPCVKRSLITFWADNPIPWAQQGMKELLHVVAHSMRTTSTSWCVLLECGLTLEGVIGNFTY